MAIAADMDSKPSDATLDLTLGGNGSLPAGMYDVVVLAAANVTEPGNWPIREGTLKMTFAVPQQLLESAGQDGQYYLVRFDGTGYQIADASASLANGTALFEVPVSGISGTFTLVLGKAMQPTAKPSPSPSPIATPSPAPSATPAPQGPVSTYVPAAVTFALGLLAGAIVLLVVSRLH